VAKSYASTAVDVRLTVPEATEVRAVVVIFRGRQPKPEEGKAVGLSASLGCLITFNLTNHLQIVAGPVRTAPPSEGSGIQISQLLSNQGSEPVVVEGTVVFLDVQGALSAKVPFGAQRLLPGEKLDFTAEYTGELRPGTYRVLCSFEYEGKTSTTEGTYKAP
jgi:hypothetical protein